MGEGTVCIQQQMQALLACPAGVKIFSHLVVALCDVLILGGLHRQTDRQSG